MFVFLFIIILLKMRLCHGGPPFSLILRLKIYINIKIIYSTKYLLLRGNGYRWLRRACGGTSMGGAPARRESRRPGKGLGKRRLRRLEKVFEVRRRCWFRCSHGTDDSLTQDLYMKVLDGPRRPWHRRKVLVEFTGHLVNRVLQFTGQVVT